MSNSDQLRSALAPFKPVFDAFSQQGKEIFAVGGCVRDALMGLPPRDDFDFATNALPKESTLILNSAGWRTYSLGARFGTITTRFHGTSVEITTYRVAEHYEPGNRKPEVVFGANLEDDLSRRDLSINAMAGTLDGGVVDPFQGQRDITNRTLQVPGGGFENTLTILADDPLRILRIARFAARLGFTPTPDTTAAAAQAAPTLQSISRERWKAELDKTLIADHLEGGLAWLLGVGALHQLFPLLPRLDGADQEPFLRQVLATPKVAATRWAVIAFWAAAAGNPAETHEPLARRDKVSQQIADRFRFSRAERRQLQTSLGSRFHREQLVAPWDKPRLRRLAVAFGVEGLRSQLDLHRAIYVDDLVLGQAIAARCAEFNALVESEDPVPHLPSGLGGRIREVLKLAPGPAVGETIDAVKNAILDGHLDNNPSLETCLQYITSIYPTR